MTKLQLDKFMYSFIERFAFSADDPKCQILKGYQNYNASRSKESIIFTRVGVTGKEENTRLFRVDGDTGIGTTTSANLRYNIYQIMSGGIDDGNEYIGQRLARLQEAFASAIGAAWFRSATKDALGGAAPIGVGQVMDQTTEGEQGAWELAYTADFTVAARMELGVDQDYAEELKPGIYLANKPV